MIFAYKLENKVNGSVYIGITEDPESRFANHVWCCRNGDERLLYRAMRKYGMNNFEFEIIAQTPVHEYKWELENILVLQYESHVLGYNMNKGGTDASHLVGTAPARLVSTGEIIGQVSLTDPRWELCEIESVTSGVINHFCMSGFSIKRTSYVDEAH